MAWRMATFNINGIRARLALLTDWLAANEPQALCLQETKVQDPDFPAGPLEDAGYHVEFMGQKAYNGVAVLTKSAPQEVVKGLDDGADPPQARFLAVKVDGLWMVNTYVPQGRSPEDPAFQYKLAFMSRVRDWLEAGHDPAEPLIWTGDFNVAPAPEDVYDPKRLEGHTGFHPEERARLAEVMAWGLEDCFRRARPEEKQFTFWDYRLPKALARGLGWRLDHVLATPPLAARLADCWVDSDTRAREKPSDHAPVLADFDL